MKHPASFTITLACIAGTFCFVTQAQAAERFWNIGTGGAFSLPTNWLNGQTLGIPTASDTATFDLRAHYTVNFTNSHSTDRVLVKRGNVTFQLGPTQYTLLNQLNSTPSIAVGPVDGNTAALTITGGALNGSFTDVGHVEGAFGMLHVLGPAGALNNTYQLRVGNQGVGRMQITDGGYASNGNASIGTGSGSSGEMTVDGADSFWNCIGDLSIGKGGFGDLTISDGALVESQDAIVAQLLSSFGNVSVTGSDSTWTIHGTLDIGMFGYGSMTISNGGTVTNEVFATIGTFNNGWQVPGQGGVGDVDVDGAGTSWHISGDLYVGYTTYGSLTISNGALVNASGLMKLGGQNSPPAPGSLTLASGGRAVVGGNLGHTTETPMVVQLADHDDYLLPAVSVGGTATGFICKVELINGFVPADGDSFKIVAAANITPLFTLQLPALAAPMYWRVTQNSTVLKLEALNCVLPSDITHNGKVDVDDLLAVVNAWGVCPQPCPPTCPADLNADCLINVTDLLAVINGWGTCQ